MRMTNGRPRSSFYDNIAYSGMLFMLFSIFLLVYLFLSLRSTEYLANRRAQVAYQLQDYSYRMGDHVDNLITFSRTIQRVIEHDFDAGHQVDALEFQTFISKISAEIDGIENIYLIKDQQINQLYRANELSLVLDPYILNYIEKTKASNSPVLDIRIQLIDNKYFFAIHTPIFISNNHQHDKFWGVITIIVNWLELFNHIGVPPPHANLQIAIRKINDLEIAAGSRALFEADPVLQDIPYSNKQWQIGAIPKNGWQSSPPNSWIWHLGGALLLIISMLSGWIWAKYPARLRATIGKNRDELYRIESGLEQQLKEGSEREINLHNILRTLPVPIIITGQESGAILYNNEQASRLFGIPENSIGQLARNYYETPVGLHNQLIDEIRRNGFCEGIEVEFKHASGSHFWGLLSSAPIQYEGQNAFLSGIHNITQRKQVELALQKSENNLHKLFDTIPAPQVIVSYSDGIIREMNISFIEFFGVNELSDTPLKLSEFFNDPEELTRLLEEIELNGFADNVEILAHNDKGESFYLLISTDTFEYAGEDCLLSSFTNITERKNAELAITQSEETLRKIFESVPTPMLFTRQSNGLILKLNTATIELFGIENPMGKPLWIADYLDDISDRQRLHDELYQHKVVRNFEIKMRNHAGYVFCVLVTATAVEYEDEPTILMGLTDITPQKRMEVKLQRAMSEAHRAVKAKSDFLATMSHELRTPLNGALSMSRLLERTLLSDEQREYVEAINFSGEVLLSTISDVLDLSAIEANRLELEERSFELEPIIKNMVRLLSIRVKKEGNTLDYMIDDNIPEILTGDPTRLRQVLFNLIGNALKFTEKGHIRVEISRTGMPDRSGAIPILFKVIDSGIGISAEQKSRLFEPYTQADSSINRQYGGSGLGLTICKHIIELMRGDIGVESLPGTGSIFWFRLSLAPGQSVSAAITQAKLPSQSLKSLTILLIEDDPINQKAESALLRQDGHQVTEASDGYAALEILKAHQHDNTPPFDLILTDIRMPGLNGMETTKLIREMPSPIATLPVFALTGDVTRKNIEICLASGIDRVLSKPIHYDEFNAALQSISIQNNAHQHHPQGNSPKVSGIEPSM